MFLLLLLCGDVETCPSPDHQDTNASLRDLLRGNGLEIFHQKHMWALPEPWESYCFSTST